MPDKLTVILADGDFPSKPEALDVLRHAERIICCDGAAASLDRFGMEPTAVIGDLDSLAREWKQKFSDRLIHVGEQETNDLTKAFVYCKNRGWSNLVILGATGKREDHTLGNLSLLADYSDIVPNLKFVTNYGIFFIAVESGEFSSVPGQQISIIALESGTKVSSSGLKFPMNELELNRWWQATLNEALSTNFRLEFTKGKKLLIFKEHPQQN